MGLRANMPRRRVVLEANIGGDSIEDVLAALMDIHAAIAAGQRGFAGHGGCHSGWTIGLTIDESVTHDSYFAEVEKLMSQRTT